MNRILFEITVVRWNLIYVHKNYISDYSKLCTLVVELGLCLVKVQKSYESGQGSVGRQMGDGVGSTGLDQKW